MTSTGKLDQHSSFLYDMPFNFDCTDVGRGVGFVHPKEGYHAQQSSKNTNLGVLVSASCSDR